MGLCDRQWRKGSAVGLVRSVMERRSVEEERRDGEAVRRETRRMKCRKNKKSKGNVNAK